MSLRRQKKLALEALQAADQRAANPAYNLVMAAQELEASIATPGSAPVVPLTQPPALIPADHIVALPPFSPKNVRTWFEQTEAILSSSRPQARQLNLLRALPTEVIQQSGANVMGSYEDIKDWILRYYDVSEESRLRELLDEQHLGDRKPSLVLRNLKALAPGNHNLIKLRFLGMLPEKVRAVMVALEGRG